MGAFYYSIHVKTDDPTPVLDAVKSIAKKTKCCLVSPLQRGWVSIFPEHSKYFEKTAKLISGKLNTPLLAVFIYDSDVLSSTVYHQGKVVDLFSSHPDYFQKVEPQIVQKYRGNSEKYDLFLDSPKDIQQLGELFDAMRGAILCTTDLPDRFANGSIMGLCPAPTRNHCLFGQGRKLMSMNLADGKVTELVTLPVEAKIVQTTHLGENTFALEVWVSFSHYGRNTRPRYLYIIELPRRCDQT